MTSECAFSFILQVYFWKAPSGQIPPPQSEYKATIDTSTTLHLQAYTSYRFQVVAYNSVGDGPASNVVGPLTTPESSKHHCVYYETVFICYCSLYGPQMYFQLLLVLAS